MRTSILYSLIFAALILGATGCTWSSKGLDACQDDACFLDLAIQAQSVGNTQQAEKFCAAIQDARGREECVEKISK